jgi:hypothetical protein
MENNAEAPPKISWSQKIKRILLFISVEPVMICWAFPAFMMFSSYENISIEKVSKLMRNRVSKMTLHTHLNFEIKILTV